MTWPRSTRSFFPLNDRQRGFFEHLSGSPERVLNRTRLVTPAGERRAEWPLVPLRREEVVRFLREGGLTGIREYGDHDGTPFSNTSPALIVVGQEGTGASPTP